MSQRIENPTDDLDAAVKYLRAAELVWSMEHRTATPLRCTEIQRALSSARGQCWKQYARLYGEEKGTLYE